MDAKDKRSTTVDYYNQIYDEDDYFDNILNMMDYPVEPTLEDDVLDENWAAKLGPIPSEVVFSDMLPPAGTFNGGRGGSFSGDVLNDTKPDPILHQETYKSQQRSYESYESHSPDSVLEQRPATSAIQKIFNTNTPIPVKSRTKRSRSTLTENPWSKSTLPIPLTLKKKKKKNFNNFTKTENNEPKICLHCEITKTPQWREGPYGPKTLCNACGVRWRSGRLYDEYRPAASPSFVPNLHSNSHRKVIEIIKKKKLIVDTT